MIGILVSFISAGSIDMSHPLGPKLAVVLGIFLSKI
tara:strand:- start:1337 stop:1444 length:108 start_codon:yes stop_codon:yes gene_type:complete